MNPRRFTRSLNHPAQTPQRPLPPTPLPTDLTGDEDCAAFVTRMQDWYSERYGDAGPTVIGRGDPQASLVVVGEAPTEEACCQGIPFVGPSGELLDEIFKKNGFKACPGGGVWMTNAAYWSMPPGTPPPITEVCAATPVLARQIELLCPRVILACGLTAIHLLTDMDRPVWQLRGYDYKLSPDISVLMQEKALAPVICTWHPAFLLRRNRSLSPLKDDVATACARANGTS